MLTVMMVAVDVDHAKKRCSFGGDGEDVEDTEETCVVTVVSMVTIRGCVVVEEVRFSTMMK